MTDGTPTHFAPLLDDDPGHIGPYTVVGRIGAGGMGSVFAAQDHQRDQYVAVKVVRDELAADPEFRARFAREVDLVQRVHSPCVPAFRGADTESATAWLATEYVPGPTLREYVRANGALSGGKLLALAAGLVEALHAIHGRGIVHRDLKPGNVILGPSGPKVLDFGIARAVGETALTRTGGVVGTAGWMSPEQYGSGQVTEQSDIFSWGALVAFAATGREPFGSGAPNALAYRVMRSDPDLEGTPGELRPLLEAALAKDPAARPTAGQTLQAVEQLWRSTRALGAAPSQDPASAVTTLLKAEWTGMEAAPPKPPRKQRRRPLLVAGAVVGALALLGGGAVAAPVLVDTLSEQGSEQEGGNDGGANGGGADNGNDGDQAGEDSDGGGGQSAGGEDGPPEAAVDQVSGGSNNDGATAQVGAAQGNVGLFTSLLGGGLAATQVFVHSPEPTDDGIQFTVNGQSQGVRAEAPGFTQDALYVVADGEELTPDSQFGYTPAPEEPQGQETNEFTLSIPGAPESGLLAFQGRTTDGEELPPVGICYDAAIGIFTIEYAECT
ncbi:serine/threonine-protein kinase [Marinitenerispora sediminis]|uniref:Serine/threonine protein kinase n=1 Tax=Marinitenerispora sediminis TaxID=1931232 RepID=A0A368T9P8_9ACTN|nr:serine/threonine-protein kinase [Marinitenerispora sediminis]RCV58127.1 serine/threonine protein kinase [Marinitenerispora sediminis]RCV58749.1 serine/threonine protein kinase [Marinitenerispora sediminis]RCV61400.1 serine/threonine protein kinase [Marinitenerispora sediminis]